MGTRFIGMEVRSGATELGHVHQEGCVGAEIIYVCAYAALVRVKVVKGELKAWRDAEGKGKKEREKERGSKRNKKDE